MKMKLYSVLIILMFFFTHHVCAESIDNVLPAKIKAIESALNSKKISHKQLFDLLTEIHLMQHIVRDCNKTEYSSMQKINFILAKINIKAINSQLTANNMMQQDLLQHQKTQTNCLLLEYYLDKMHQKVLSMVYMVKNNSLLLRTAPFADNFSLQALLFQSKKYATKNIVLYLLAALILATIYMVMSTKAITGFANMVVVYEFLLAISSGIYLWSLYIINNREFVVPLKYFNFVPALYLCISFRLIAYNISKNSAWFTAKEALALYIWIALLLLLFALYVLTPSLLSIYNDSYKLQYCVANILLDVTNLCWCVLIYKIAAKFRPKINLSYVLYVLYSFVLLSAACGYFILAIYLIPTLISSYFLCYIVIDITNLLRKLYIQLNDPADPYSKLFRKIAGLTQKKKLTGLFGFRIIIPLPVYIYSMYAFFELWGMDATLFHVKYHMYQAMHGELTVFGTTLNPVSLVQSYLLFYVMLLASRVVAQYIDRHCANLDASLKDFYINLARYLVIVSAILLILILNNVNLKGLLVITGALSIGLGLGLQHFASDFMSGLYILINKPIQIGDHVLIKDKEGYVKSIGIVSTTLRTPGKSILIVPNSKIMKKSIINFTYHNNKEGAIVIQILLEDQTQHLLAKKLLLDIAAKNKDIYQHAPNEPIVLFKINYLELNCLVKNVQKKDFVSSNLNEIIIDVFNSNNIHMTLGRFNQII